MDKPDDGDFYAWAAFEQYMENLPYAVEDYTDYWLLWKAAYSQAMNEK